MNTVGQKRWEFSARDGEGRPFSGVVEAETKEEARNILVGRQLMPISIESEKSAQAFYLRRRAQPRALVIFTRQFATLLDAGLPLLSILRMLTDLTEDRALRKALVSVSQDVNNGSSLSDALRAQPYLFGPIYIHTVQSGEVGGKLPEALNRVADYLEASQELQDRVVGALIYPLVVILVAIGAISVILTFVVPVFTDLFESEGLELPFTTRVLVAVSNLLVKHWPVLVLLAGGLAVALRQAIRVPVGRRILDMFVLRIPLVGELIRKTAIARLTRAMASLVHSGVSLSDALLASAPISGNWEVQAAILHARDAIQAGSDLATPMARADVLPQLLSQMVRVGEESGRLEEMLDKVASFYETEVRVAIDGAMKALEPMLIVVLGVVLGTIVVAMYMPVFDLMTSLG